MGAGKQPKGGNLSWTLLPTSLCALFYPPDRGDHEHEHEHERVTPTLKTLASDASPGPFHSRQTTPTQTDRATLPCPACSEGQGTGSANEPAL